MPKCKNQNNAQRKNKKTSVKPGDIKGKLSVRDTRERKDGPGGE